MHFPLERGDRLPGSGEPISCRARFSFPGRFQSWPTSTVHYCFEDDAGFTIAAQSGRTRPASPESKSSPLARPSQRDNSRLSIQAPAARQTLDGIDARTALACSLHKALSFRAELNRPQQSAVQHVQRTCADVQKLDSGSWLRRTCRPRNVVVRNCPKGRREKLTTS